MVISYLFAGLIAYLFGSISSAIIVSKLMGLPDPRTEGSRNPGATNVLRLGGKKAALITLLGDSLKGFLPVFFVKWYGMDSIALSLVALAAFIGHIYPVFFRFQGGKGVATALGCILALCWPAGLSWIITWLLVAIIFGYSSLAALIASLLAPVYIWYFTNTTIYVATITLMSGLLFYRHRSNIRKLLAGTEGKIRAKKS